MGDVMTTVDTYLAMWNETDPTRRAGHIAQAWTGDGCYVDPLIAAEGHSALSAMVDGVQAKFPGHRFRRVSGIDTHHDQLRFAWDLVAPARRRGRLRNRRGRARRRWSPYAHHRVFRRAPREVRNLGAPRAHLIG
jgi:hypothetical protein